MPFCNACGAELMTDAAFCNKCGRKVTSDNTKEPASQNSVEEKTSKKPEQNVSIQAKSAVTLNPELQSLSKEASITLADKLTKDYKAYESAKKEVADLESLVNRPYNSSNTNNFNFLQEYRPYIIAVAVEFNALIIIGLVFSSNIGMAKAARIGFFLSLLILIAGIFKVLHTKKVKEALYNEAIENGKKKKQDDLSRLGLLKRKLAELEHNLKEYDELIPTLLRQSSYMSRAKVMIQTGKANNLYEAFENLLKT